jgi:hypothetical protein
VGLLDKYGDNLCLEGGFDSSGKPSRPDASVEEVTAEVERCFREYGSKKGFIFTPLQIGSVEKFQEKMTAIAETANRIRFAGK